MRNCSSFNYNLFFPLEAVFEEILENYKGSDFTKSGPLSSIKAELKHKIKSEFNLDVQDNELNDYLKQSFLISEDQKKALTNVVSSAIQEEVPEISTKYDENEEVIDNENDLEDHGGSDLSETSVPVGIVVPKPLGQVNGKVGSLIDIYTQYFGKSMPAYNLFIGNFGRDVFSNSFVSFKKGDSYLVQNDIELNRNFEAYKNKLVEVVSKFAGVSQDADFLAVAKSKFAQYSTSNLNSEATINPNGELIQSYFAYLSLTHFDQLLKYTLPLVKVNPNVVDGKYSLAIHHKVKNNFSDSLVNMIDELPGLSKQLIERVPKLDSNGNEISGQYLKNDEVVKLAGAIKDISSFVTNAADFKDALSISMKMRMNPEVGAGEIMRYVLANPSKKGLVDKDTRDIMASVYNYFYKREGDELSIKGLNKDTDSLLSIKMSMFDSEGVGFNALADTLTNIIDKTISQKYVTMEETMDGLERRLTKDRSANRFVSEVKQQLNNLANMKPNPNVKIEGDKVSFELGSLEISGSGTDLGTNLSIRRNNAPVLATLKNTLYEKLTPEEWSNFNNGNVEGLTEPKLEFAKAISTLSSMLNNLQLHQGNGEIITLMNRNPFTIVSELSKMVLVSNFYATKKAEFNENPNGATLESFSTFTDDVPISGGMFTPFTKSPELTGFFSLYGQANAEAKGYTTAAISRNNNGDGVPNSSLLNMIGDDLTNFQRIKDAPADHALKNNLFAQENSDGDSVNLPLLAGTVYRQDVQMRTGDPKASKKFNASELAMTSIFHDFWLNQFSESTPGRVMIEPIVCADKTPQPMKVYNLNHKVNYIGKDGQVFRDKNIYELYADGELQNLHKSTMHAQYSGLYDKLITDYSKLLNTIETSIPELVSSLYTSLGIKTKMKKGISYETLSSLNQTQLKGLIDGVVSSLKSNKLSFNDFNSAAGVDLQLEFHLSAGSLNETLFHKFKEYEVLKDKDYSQYYSDRMIREDLKFVKSMQDLGLNVPVLDVFGNVTKDFEKILNVYLSNIEGVAEEDLEQEIDKFVKKHTDLSGHLVLATDADGNAVNITEGLVYSKEGKNIKINPLIDFFSQTYRALNSNYLLGTVGGAHAHKLGRIQGDVDKIINNPENPQHKTVYQNYKNQYGEKLAKEFLFQEVAESTRTLAMHKRMVAMMAKMHSFTIGTMNGMVRHMKVAVVSDLTQYVNNSAGDDGYFDVADGSGWLPMTAVLHYRNSMGTMAKDSHTLKTIRHHLDTDTGIAQLDKHALQALSNEVLRRSVLSPMNLSVIHKKALGVGFNKIFTPELLSVIDPSMKTFNMFHNAFAFKQKNVTRNHEADKNNLDSVSNLEMPYFLKGKKIKFSVEGSGIIGETTGMGFDSNLGMYVIKQRFTNELGQPAFPLEQGYTKLNDAGEYFKLVTINNNHDLWEKALGGMWSLDEVDAHDAQFTNNGKHYAYGDASHEALVDFQNNIVIRKSKEGVLDALRSSGIITEEPLTGANENLENQANYFQPLKESMIWHVNNASGIKNGARNVNPSNVWLDSSDMQYYNTESLHYGIQGNFDHHFSEDHEARVTESSQMLSLAEANGYMHNEVNRLYKALATVVEHSISNELGALVKGNKDVAMVLTKTLINTLKTKEHLGLAQAYGENVLKELKTLKSGEYLEQFKVAFSDPNFYNAMVSMVSGALNSRAIKRDLSGIAAVLSQGHDSIMVTDTDSGIVFSDAVRKEKIKELVAKYNKQLSEGDFSEYNSELDHFTKTSGEDISKNEHTTSDSVAIDDDLRVGDFTFKLPDVKSYYKYKNLGIGAVKGVITKDDGYYAIINGIETKIADLGQEFNVQIRKGIPRNLKANRLLANYVTESGLSVKLNEMDLAAAKAVWALVEYQDVYEKNASNGKFLDYPTIIKSIQNGKILDHYVNELLPNGFTEYTSSNIKALKEGLLKIQQNQYDLAQAGQFTTTDSEGNEMVIEAKSKILPGELVLPNYNFSKFGIEPGKQIAEITRDYFAARYTLGSNNKGKTNTILDNNANLGEFYLIRKPVNDHGVKISNNLQLMSADTLKSISNDSSTIIEELKLTTKSIEGSEYYVDINGTVIGSSDLQIEYYNINGVPTIVYNSIADVNNIAQHSESLGIGYNFSGLVKADDIINYINEYDFDSSRYINNATMETGHDQSSLEQIMNVAKKSYDKDRDVRFNQLINKIHASWNKQLDMLGVRIPAQALQSLMAMRIVGFTEKNVNRAYVPVKKNWLDGSDFKPDASGFKILMLESL